MTEAISAIPLTPLAIFSCAFAGLWIAVRTSARNRQSKTRYWFVEAYRVWRTRRRKAAGGGEAHVALAGMPPRSIRTTISAAGRIPTLLFYFPVLLHCLRLALRHGGFTLPSVANPNIVCGGFRGESKMSYLSQIPPHQQHWVAPSLRLVATPARKGASGGRHLEQEIAQAGLRFPLVVKPDIGSQGYGVRLLRSPAALDDYLDHFPSGEGFILQRYIDWEGEAGVHYLRKPGEARGRIFSLGFRCFPHVLGDGRSRLCTLIEADPRTRRMARRHCRAVAAQLQRVPAKGEMVRLSLLGGVRTGGLYYDGSAYVTAALVARFDEIARAMPDFHFGRFDVRFKSVEALGRGEDFQIMEVNGASAEAIHIWDPEHSIAETYRVLFEQFRLLYEIGAQNRDRGYRPIGLGGYLALQWKESRLLRRYPESG
ncbi:hypothetical protein HBA54_26645 [Pelagibius litoralis]|uniref:ATP-grasp fold RimK-type domain-containing protein n=1 Tax=Pelagibius litoralis TaxID=374515 RepID=A0A967F2W1_9PROT|nr:hypothetical protein [Pelagibius litoralis]NIA72174.1 hypothetical protein [Pelagibius litoralis]